MPAIRTAGVQIKGIPRYSGSGIQKLKENRIKQSEEFEVEQSEDAVEKEHLETELEPDQARSFCLVRFNEPSYCCMKVRIRTSVRAHARSHPSNPPPPM